MKPMLSQKCRPTNQPSGQPTHHPTNRLTDYTSISMYCTMQQSRASCKLRGPVLQMRLVKASFFFARAMRTQHNHFLVRGIRRGGSFFVIIRELGHGSGQPCSTSAMRLRTRQPPLARCLRRQLGHLPTCCGSGGWTTSL